jgi:hypothetical protein
MIGLEHPLLDTVFSSVFMLACGFLAIWPNAFIRVFSYGTATQKDVNKWHVRITRVIAAIVGAGTAVDLVRYFVS